MRLSLIIICGTAAALAASLTAYGEPASHHSARKRVEIDKTNQVLRAYEGDHLVFVTNISTGMPGKETPNGYYHARDKDLMHYSTLYENAPMPYSVQVNRNYFIHGFSYVPSWPASHGCIRLPIDAARRFYGWVRLGTPVEISGHWRGSLSAATQRPSGFSLFGNSYRTVRIERAYPADWKGRFISPVGSRR